MKHFWSTVVFAALSLGSAVAQQPLRETPPEEPMESQLARRPTVGAMGIRETMGQIVERQRRALPDTPRWMFGPTIKKNGSEMWLDSVPSPMEGMSGWPNSSSVFEVPEPRITVGDSWIGPTVNDAGFVPPDSHGAVGLTQVMVVVNGRLRVYNKTGTQQFDVQANTFFDSVRGTTNAVDPRAVYDPLTNRWFVVSINTGSSNRVLLAVSAGGTITNTSSFTFFQFQQDAVGTPGVDAGQFFDYPTMGIDNNAIYIGGNVFGGGTPTIFVVRKSSVLGAGPVVVKDFRNIGGFSSPHGVDNPDPSATQGYFMGVSADNLLGFRRISDPGGNPTISSLITLTVPTTAAPANFAPQGSTSPVDSIDRRFFNAQIRLNRITGTRSLWASHNSRITSAGVASTTGDRLGGRWYQIINLTTTPTLVQSGTLFSPNTTARHFNMSTIAMSGQGHATIASTTYGSDLFASVGGSFRLRTDPPGVLEVPTVLQSSSSSYNIGLSGSRYRWGDYSQTVVDPADDMTFWTFQEYVSATDVWAVRAIEVRPPGPAQVSTLSPSTIGQGTTNNIVVTGTSVAGREFFDPGAGFVGRLQAAFSGTGLTVNSVTFNSPTTFTMNVTASAAAPLGLRNLVVTNPDGQATTGTNVLNVSTSVPAPTLTSLGTTQKVTLSPGFSLVVTGTNFTANSVVSWNGVGRATAFNSGTQLTATIPASDLVSAAVVPITVFTPGPGGGTSNALNFNVVRTTLNQPVQLLNHVSPGNRPVTVEVRNVGSTTPLQTFTPTLSSGNYSILLDIAPGTYDVAVRGSTWLRKVNSSVNFNGNATITAASTAHANGDCNGDNIVDIADYAILAGAFDAVVGDPGYAARADLNGDGIVDIADYAILAGSFDLVGDN